jgi:cytochrome c oxidase assembly protein subunit 15
MPPASRRFATFAWAALAANLVVILWGAYVRATGSGAGCGAHWPLCNGEVVPRAPAVATLVELTHRLTSGLVLILAVILFVWARRHFAPGHGARRGATAVLALTLTEAAVGAGLVLFRLVGTDASVTRVVSMAIHLVVTFLLLGALTLTATRAAPPAPRPRAPAPGRRGLLGLGLAGVLLVGVTGAVTALGDTLFPPAAGGGAPGTTAHFLVRLRVIHPLVAVVVGGYLVVLAGLILEGSRRLAFTLLALVAVQLGAGLATVILKAPVWMQLVHLGLGDLLWVTLVLAADRARRPAPAAARRDAPRGAITTAPAGAG